MKKSISDLYEQILFTESEKNSLQNPSNDEVGKLPSENIFGSAPDVNKGEGPEKAKLAKGPSYNRVDTGSTNLSSKQKSSSLPKSSPAQNPKLKKATEMNDDDDVMPEDDEDAEEATPKTTFNPYKKNKPHQESFNMSAFEELFKKTINEEMDEETPDMDTDLEGDDADVEEGDENPEENESTEEELENEEEDLMSDLRSLQDKLNSILDKLESVQNQEEEEEAGEGESEEYDEEDFDGEFGDDEEEMPVKESKQSNLKPVNKSKIATLQNKKNKVGKISPKGGKAKTSDLRVSPNPTAVGDKKKELQKNNKVRSSIDKGDFFK